MQYGRGRELIQFRQLNPQGPRRQVQAGGDLGQLNQGQAPHRNRMPPPQGRQGHRRAQHSRGNGDTD